VKMTDAPDAASLTAMLAVRVAAVRARIEAAAERAGRSLSDITLTSSALSLGRGLLLTRQLDSSPAFYLLTTAPSHRSQIPVVPNQNQLGLRLPSQLERPIRILQSAVVSYLTLHLPENP